jgi:hypothetical protein
VDYNWLQSFLRGAADNLTENWLDNFLAWLEAAGEPTLEEAMAGQQRKMEAIEAANPGWYRAGELTGTGLQVLAGTALPRLAATQLGELGLAAGMGALTTGLSWAGSAPDFDAALKLGALGALTGWVVGPYTAIPTTPVLGFMTGLGYNLGMEALGDLAQNGLPRSGAALR